MTKSPSDEERSVLNAIELLVSQGQAEYVTVDGKPGVRLIKKEKVNLPDDHFDFSNRGEAMNLYELHESLTAGLFPPYSNEDERFLALALCGEVGEIANKIKKRWRDGVDLSNEIREEIADARVYLELLAKCFGIEGEKLDAEVERKLL